MTIVRKAEESTLLKPATREETNRFWYNVKKVAALDECWHWKGYRQGDGYGSLTFRRSKMLAHRLAFYLEYGYWPRPLCLHQPTCKRHCVNPKHLREGTQLENIHDPWAPHKYKARRR